MRERTKRILLWTLSGFLIGVALVELLAIFAIIFTSDTDEELRKTDYDCELRDPSYKEMKEFLTRDKTNLNEGSEGMFFGLFGYYDCSNFTRDVKRNAIKKGIRCAGVFIWFKEGESGHALVAFDTIDKGVIFIEPQTDEEVEVAVGIIYFPLDKIITSGYIYWPELKNESN